MINNKSVFMLSVGFIVILFNLSGCSNLDGFINMNVIETEPELTPAAFDPMDKAKLVDVQPYNVERLDIEHYSDRQFLVNGKQFIDQKGVIDRISPISDTGYVTYASLSYEKATNSSVFLVKTGRPFDGKKDKVIGTLRRDRNFYHFQHAKDKQVYSGSGFFLGSRGILINKDNAAFTYIDKEGVVVTHSLPRGYFVSKYQKGDLSSSDHLLILKDLGQTKALGFLKVEGEHEYDASLISLSSGAVSTTIKIKLEGGGEKRRLKHLRNVFYMYGSTSGPIVVSLEDGAKKVVARNLATNKKVVLHERGLGIAFIKAGVNDAGSIWVKLANGLQDKYIDNVVSVF